MARAALLLSLAWAMIAPSAGPPSNVPTSDLQGEPLPKGARARLGSTRLRHGYTVSGLAFSPDGKTLASTAGDHTLRFWDVKTGKQLRAVGEDMAHAGVYQPTRWLLAVAYSGNGKLVATASQDFEVRVYDAATAKERQRVRTGMGATGLALSPDGKTLATVNRQRHVEIHDLAAGGERAGKRGRIGTTREVAFSPDGKTVAAAGHDGYVRFWDVAKAAEASHFSGFTDVVTSVSWSADGKRIAGAAGPEGRLVVWDPATGKELARHAGRRGENTWVAFLPDNRSLVTRNGQDGRIRVWDEKLKVTREMEGPASVVVAALSPDGKTLALGTYFGAIHLLELASGKLLDLAPGHHGHVQHVAVTPDGRRVLTGSGDGTFRLWDAETSREIALPANADHPGTPIGLSDGARLAATKKGDGPVRAWDPLANKVVRILEGSEDALLIARLSEDGRLLTTTHANGTVKLWDVATGKPLRELKGHRGKVTAVAITPDREFVASSGEDVTVRLWRVGTGAEVRRMEGFNVDAYSEGDPRNLYSRLAFSPDGRSLARGGTDGIVRVFETASGKVVREFRGHAGYVMTLKFSSDGRSLAVGCWMGTRLWDLPSGEGRGEVLGHKGDAMAVTFTPDIGRLVTGGSDTMAYVWDVSTAFRPAPPRVVKLSEKDAAARWEGLTNAVGEKAYQATWDLAAAPTEAIPLLAKHLKPVKPASEKVIAKLIADLEDDDFDTRTKANEELSKLGEVAAPQLRKALAVARDVDLKLRLNVLVANLDAAMPPAETLRTVRAVQVLELAGTPAARKLLQDLAEGAPVARLTREAKAALGRLK